MASLMLSVGDMQVSVFPTGSEAGIAPEFQGVWAQLPDDHPLKVGTHRVTFYEIGVGQNVDEVCSALLDEPTALEVVGLWLTLETPSDTMSTPGGGPGTRNRLRQLMGDGIEAFMP